MTIKPRKKKDGTTVYDVQVMRNGVRYNVTCGTHHAARQAEIDFQTGNVTGLGTLSEYINHVYLPLAKKRLAETSYDTYRREIDKRILPALGHYRIRDIDRIAVQSMIDECQTLAVARKAQGVLKTILNECMADDLISRNPAAAKFAYPEKGSKRDNRMVLSTFEQINVFLDVVERDGDSTCQKLAFSGLLQGLRPEERYALDWGDIDTLFDVIRIDKAYVTTSGGNKMKKPKTELSRRTIPMHPRFKQWIMSQPKTKGAWMKGADGKRISPSTARKRWIRFLAEHPYLPPITIENMRHSFATSYLAAGGRVETLSKLLGHSQTSTTFDRYVKPDIASLKDEMRKVAKFRY